MPTARPRHMITETDELAQAIDAAASVWPESRGERAELLRHIIGEGIQALETSANETTRKRLAAINKAAGSLPGSWPENSREEMVGEWPA